MVKKIKRAVDREESMAAYEFIRELLPYYWVNVNLLPAKIKLKLAINGFHSILEAVIFLQKSITDRNLSRRAEKEIRNAQVYGHGEVLDNTTPIAL